MHGFRAPERDTARRRRGRGRPGIDRPSAQVLPPRPTFARRGTDLCPQAGRPARTREQACAGKALTKRRAGGGGKKKDVRTSRCGRAHVCSVHLDLWPVSLLHYALRRLDEGQDVLNLCAHRYLVCNLLQGIFGAEVALVDEAIGVHNMAQDAVGDVIGHMVVLQHDGIDTVVGSGVSGHDDVGRNVFADAATALHKHPATDVYLLLQDDAAAEDGAVVYAAVAPTMLLMPSTQWLPTFTSWHKCTPSIR